MKNVWVMYGFGMIFIVVAIVLVVVGFGSDPFIAKFEDVKQLETENKLFIKAKGEKLDVAIPDGLTDNIDGYKKLFIGKLEVQKINVDGQDIVALTQNQSFIGFVYAVVPRGEVPEFNALLSDYEKKNNVSYGSYVVVDERLSGFMYAALVLIVLGFIFIRPGQKAIDKAVRQREDYV